MALEYTCGKAPAVVYKLRGPVLWANITIREWPEGGSIDVKSDYGDYAYTWRSIGKENLRAFLCGLNRDYFMGKVMGSAYDKFDSARTVAEIRKHLVETRRNGEFDKVGARDIWDALRNVYGTETVTQFAFEMGGHWDNLAYKLYEGPQEIPWRYTPPTQAVNFWDIVWPCACEVWRKELAEEAACSSPS